MTTILVPLLSALALFLSHVLPVNPGVLIQLLASLLRLYRQTSNGSLLRDIQLGLDGAWCGWSLSRIQSPSLPCPFL